MFTERQLMVHQRLTPPGIARFIRSVLLHRNRYCLYQVSIPAVLTGSDKLHNSCCRCSEQTR
jgi:hypothetical protein